MLRYRAWADLARAKYREAKRTEFPEIKFLGQIRYKRVSAMMFFQMPAGLNPATKKRMKGKPHDHTPDWDNLSKALCDALYPTGDEHIYDGRVQKFWDDGNGARVEVTLY